MGLGSETQLQKSENFAPHFYSVTRIETTIIWTRIQFSFSKLVDVLEVLQLNCDEN